VYELYPSSENPSFISIAQGRSTKALNLLAKANDLVALQQSNTIIVWDFVKKLACKYQTKHVNEAVSRSLPLSGHLLDDS
jgi:hypothetical protein